MTMTANPMHPIDSLSARDGYDRWAAVYDDDGNPLIALEEPRVAELLGDVAGLRVLDLGCGTGRHAIALARARAILTAIDFSAEMLKRARAKAARALPLRLEGEGEGGDGALKSQHAPTASRALHPPPNPLPRGRGDLSFLQHDLHQPLPLEDQAFDRIVCGLVLEHIRDLDHLFREMHRLCKDDGFIVLSAMHPAMMLRGVSARFTDPQTQRETRPHSLDHSISDFVMAALRAGLRLDHLSEHAMDEATAARFPRGERYLNWPMLVMMKLRPAVQPR